MGLNEEYIEQGKHVMLPECAASPDGIAWVVGWLAGREEEIGKINAQAVKFVLPPELEARRSEFSHEIFVATMVLETVVGINEGDSYQSWDGYFEHRKRIMLFESGRRVNSDVAEEIGGLSLRKQVEEAWGDGIEILTSAYPNIGDYLTLRRFEDAYGPEQGPRLLAQFTDNAST